LGTNSRGSRRRPSSIIGAGLCDGELLVAAGRACLGRPGWANSRSFADGVAGSAEPEARRRRVAGLRRAATVREAPVVARDVVVAEAARRGAGSPSGSATSRRFALRGLGNG
jgi:hypothetical protein